jgi:hypothetical protein
MKIDIAVEMEPYDFLEQSHRHQLQQGDLSLVAGLLVFSGCLTLWVYICACHRPREVTLLPMFRH